MAATVLQVGGLPQALAEAVTARYDVVVLPTDKGRADFLATHAGSIRVIVDAGRVPVDDELMGALPHLGAIVHYGDGHETVDTEAASKRGIGVSNTPDVLTDTVADTAVALMLMTMRRLGAAERYVRAGRWAADGPYPLARDVTGSRVGILGLGRIGSAIAYRLTGFDCAIAYHNRRERADVSYRYAATPVELAALVDVLVVATSGEKDAPPLVSREVLESLGPHGYLINVARGGLVDQGALIELLVSGRLAGAGLDVVIDEPVVPQQLRELDNVVVLPHVGSATAPTRAAMAALAMRNLDEYLASGTLVSPVVAPGR
jgi:lactate dehydrogenase-like 2-hydroxyacid dehydrogenase